MNVILKILKKGKANFIEKERSRAKCAVEGDGMLF